MEDTLTRPRQSTFKRNAHITYFKRCLQALPAQATGHDSNRITIAYFCISGLDLLGALETVSWEDRSSWVDWVWSLQAPGGGFRGSSFMTTSNPSTSPGHLPSTYTAILALALLREPLDKLDLSGLESFLRSCQAEDGSFSPLPKQYIEGAFQSDLRMTYCATVIGHLTGFEGYDSDSALRMIEGSRTWEGGYASRQGVIEAQGGTTYCAIASRSLIDTLHTTQVHNESTIRWLAQRQIGGFQGRPGKLEDVCYSFWCGAALKILGADEIINKDEDKDFLLSAQSPMGGFGKEPEDYPDPYHSYLALAALALHQDPLVALKTLDAQLNIPEDTASWLRTEMDRIKSVES